MNRKKLLSSQLAPSPSVLLFSALLPLTVQLSFAKWNPEKFTRPSLSSTSVASSPSSSFSVLLPSSSSSSKSLSSTTLQQLQYGYPSIRLEEKWSKAGNEKQTMGFFTFLIYLKKATVHAALSLFAFASDASYNVICGYII
uniref:Transmembrane protein n=1 Tax=Syphacia muris TaxID=451379 RepID=A0A0N5A9V2_9BILA